MKIPSIGRHAIVLVAICCASSGAVRPAQAQCPDLGTVVFEDVTSAGGRPFEAREIRTIVIFRADQTKQVRVIKANLFRDSTGRVRVEQFYDGTDDPPVLVPSRILIYDHCGTSITLVPASHTASTQHPMSAGEVSHKPYCQDFDPKALPQPGPAGRFEDLGTKMIGDVEVQGFRTSEYESVDAKLSGAPAIHVFEQWCSKRLDNVMESLTQGDNPKREVTTQIRDVKFVEPDAGLFEIPKDYTLPKVNGSEAAASTPPKSANASSPK